MFNRGEKHFLSGVVRYPDQMLLKLVSPLTIAVAESIQNSSYSFGLTMINLQSDCESCSLIIKKMLLNSIRVNAFIAMHWFWVIQETVFTWWASDHFRKVAPSSVGKVHRAELRSPRQEPRSLKKIAVGSNCWKVETYKTSVINAVWRQIHMVGIGASGFNVLRRGEENSMFSSSNIKLSPFRTSATRRTDSAHGHHNLKNKGSNDSEQFRQLINLEHPYFFCSHAENNR